MTSTFHKLRSQHPALRYRGYSVERRGHTVSVTYDILLEPSVEFRPTLTFPLPPGESDRLAPFLFSIGMVELLSYWKAACPRRVIIEGAHLTETQLAWWHDLFIHGLGEFYFVNDIDPSDPELLTIESVGQHPLQPAMARTTPLPRGELVLAAGGKDSSLALEMLKEFDPTTRRAVMILNPTRSALESAQLAGYQEPILVKRTIDKNLLTLNSQGYLNGHTPFSAYLAFLATMIADLQGLDSVIVSNERSASEENTIFHGLAVNHQYSKGLRFERRFREYAAKEFPGCASYYSLIRPLYDLQVSSLFARLAPNHLSSFRSCNVGQREDRWCGSCPKCAFVALTLAPFVTPSEHTRIFDGTLFAREEILKAIEELTGLRNHKPLECVGTINESRDALVLTLAHYEGIGAPPPQGLIQIASRLTANNALPSLEDAQRTLRSWSDDHELPEHYAKALYKAVQGDA